MKSKKKIYITIFLIIWFILMVIFNIKPEKEEKFDTLENGGRIIENFDSISAWKTYDYERDFLSNRGSKISIVNDGYDGKSLLISGDVLNDVRVYKTLNVSPNSYYKVSVMLKAKTSEDGCGAAISSLYCDEKYNYKDTNDEWVNAEFYIKTSENQKSIDLSLGLGGHSAVSSGYAYFDNFTLEKVNTENVPDDADIITFEKFNDDEIVKEKLPIKSWTIVATLVVLLVILADIVIEKEGKELKDNQKLSKKDYIIIAILTVICAIISFYKLGNTYAPKTYWKAGEEGEYITIKFDDLVSIDCIAHCGNKVEKGYYRILSSEDGENYTEEFTLGEFEDGGSDTQKIKAAFYEWRLDYDLDIYAKYIKIECVEPGWGINELSFLTMNEDEKYEILPFEIEEFSFSKKSVGTPEMLFDEQEMVPNRVDYMYGIYFDEVYFPQTAYDQLHGNSLYEVTHPPFGKTLISIGIQLFGMTPFGWRFMGTLFGVLLVPLMYLFGMKIFKNRKFAFVTAFLIMFDFMRFAQTRLATIDSYATFFVLCMYYFMFDYFIEKTKKNETKSDLKTSLKPLLLCGIMFGIGAATKWSCIYAAVGLAFLFFLAKFYEYLNVKNEKEELKKWFKKDFMPTCAWCVLFFVIIPIIIYSLTYIPYKQSHPGESLFEIITTNIRFMFKFHSGLVDTHPFESAWWTWPINLRPLLAFIGYDFSNNTCSTIASFGNPAVWITSTIAIIVSIIFTIKDKDRRGLFLLVAYIFQVMPWILITRSSFIYAYFIPLPYAIMSIVYCIQKISKNRKIDNILLIVYLLVVLALFIAFFPAISGMWVDRDYLISLEWLPTWTLD